MLRASRVTQHAVTHAVDTLRISSRLTARSAAAGGGRAGGIGATSAIRAAAIHQSRMGPAGSMDTASAECGWVSLRTPRTELVLNHTLPTGQSFRWRLNTDGDYVGVIGKRVVSMRQATDDVLYRVHCRPNGEDATHDAAALADYFNLSVSLASLSVGWAKADARFAKLEPHLPGCRMLRQDPAECLFSFICSSNNHISRIHGMVERLCAAYGTKLVCHDDALRAMRKATTNPTGTPQKESNKNQSNQSTPTKDSSMDGEPLGDFYSFPTVDQLRAATETDLRGMGFGYRAKFIAGSVSALIAKEGGADVHLSKLRNDCTYKEAQADLATLPGVGPKVAACACLFSLDKHDAIPVDTHVWQLAVEHYCRELEGKSLTPKVMDAVEDAIVAVFGAYAGWAHNTLFIAELAHVRAALPEELRTPPRQKVATPKKEAKTKAKKEAASVKVERPSGKKSASKRKDSYKYDDAGETLDGLAMSPGGGKSGGFRIPKKTKAEPADEQPESEYL